MGHYAQPPAVMTNQEEAALERARDAVLEACEHLSRAMGRLADAGWEYMVAGCSTERAIATSAGVAVEYLLNTGIEKPLKIEDGRFTEK